MIFCIYKLVYIFVNLLFHCPSSLIPRRTPWMDALSAPTLAGGGRFPAPPLAAAPLVNLRSLPHFSSPNASRICYWAIISCWEIWVLGPAKMLRVLAAVCFLRSGADFWGTTTSGPAMVLRRWGLPLTYLTSTLRVLSSYSWIFYWLYMTWVYVSSFSFSLLAMYL